MIEFFSQAWVKFASIAAGVAVLAGFIGNAKKIKDWAKEKAEKRKKRREAPGETLALVKSMQQNMEKLEANVTNVTSKINSLDLLVDVVSGQVKDVSVEVKALKKETTAQSKMLNNLDSDTADLLASQLTREHDFYVRKGYCPTHDKERIGMIYQRYRDRGRNHISTHLMDDILSLPIDKT